MTRCSHITYRIHGLDCAEEVAALRAELEPLPGVRELAFDVLNSRLSVRYAEAATAPDELVAAIRRTGLRAEVWNNGRTPAARETRWLRWGRTVMTTISGLLLASGFVVHGLLAGWTEAIGGGGVTPPPAVAMYLGAIIAGAWYVAPKAGRALLRLRADMNLLMTVAVTGAVVLGELFEAATVAFLFSLSLALEAWSVGRARRAIASLMSLTPEKARLPGPDGHEELVDVHDVPAGSRVVVRPGDRVPLDGTVVRGETSINEASITGEALPADKRPGSSVFAGTINEEGAIEIVTSRPAEDTTLARIIRLVSDAQRKRSPSEQWVETFARFYTPAVMLLAAAITVLPPLLLGAAWAASFYQGLVLLVIACPCALVISTPVSIVAAMTSAARHGVLVKGGPFMELPARLEAVALDKTGTLTEGHPEVERIIPLSGHDECEVLELAAAVELRSSHPLARAIVRCANARGIRPAPADDFQVIRGKGAVASVNGRRLWVGSHRYLEQRGQATPAMSDHLESFASNGSSVVVIGKDEHVCGLIAISDHVRPQAREAVGDMRAAGVRHVVMLTGDSRARAEAVGRETGVDEVRAELLPDAKLAAVEELVARYGRVAMVGDGVNDAPAMARANLGIAMGAAGTDAALETADIALMSDDLSRLPWLIRHARRTLSIIRQNITVSLAVKALFVVLAFAGLATLWGAIVADMGVSLLVVLNALRLLRPRVA